MRDSTFGDPGRPRRRDVVQGRADDERLRPRDRDPERAAGARDRASGPATPTYEFTDPPGAQHVARRTTTRCCPATASATSGATGSRPATPTHAGHTLVATATRNGRTLIAVILGACDSGYTWARPLLDAGFRDAERRRAPARRCRRSRCRRTRDRAADQHGVRRRSRAAPKATTAAGDAHHARTGRDHDATDDDPADNGRRRSRRRPATAAQQRPTASQRRRRHLPARASSCSCCARARRRVRPAAPRGEAPARPPHRAPARSAPTAMRSGGLPVVDGRYRTGTRIGPPVESHVRVAHAHRLPTSRQPTRAAAANRRRRLSRLRYQGIETPPLGRSI